MSITIHNLNAPFLGKLQGNFVAVWFSQLCATNLVDLFALNYFRNNNTFFLGDVFTVNSANKYQFIGTAI